LEATVNLEKRVVIERHGKKFEVLNPDHCLQSPNLCVFCDRQAYEDYYIRSWVLFLCREHFCDRQAYEDYYIRSWVLFLCREHHLVVRIVRTSLKILWVALAVAVAFLALKRP